MRMAVVKPRCVVLLLGLLLGDGVCVDNSSFHDCADPVERCSVTVSGVFHDRLTYLAQKHYPFSGSLMNLNYATITTQDACSVDVAAFMWGWNVTSEKIYLVITYICQNRRISFKNSYGLVDKNIILELNLRHCVIYWKDLAALGSWTVLHSINLIDSPDEFGVNKPECFDDVALDESGPVEILKGNVTMEGNFKSGDSDEPLDELCAGYATELPVIRSLSTLYSFRSSYYLSPVMTNYSWPMLSEFKMESQSATASEVYCLKYSMPRLQSLALDAVLFPWGTPPIQDFPWNSATMKLPYNLRRPNERSNSLFTDYGTDRRTYTISSVHIGNLSGVILRGNLMQVSMTSCTITELGPNTFNELDGLQSLDLSYNELTYVPETLLHGLDLLHTFIIKENWLSAIPTHFFQNTKNLENIFFDGNHIKSLNALVFQDIELVQSISFSDNGLENISDYAIGYSPTSYKLNRLAFADFSNNHLVDFPQWLFYVPTLANISLAGNNITSAGFQESVDRLNPLMVKFGSGSLEISECDEFRPNIPKIVDFRYNPISYLSLSLNLKYLLNFYALDFNNTALSCDCHMLELYLYLKYVNLRQVTVYNIPGIKYQYTQKLIVCHSPPSSRGRSMIEATRSFDYCPKFQRPFCPAQCMCYTIGEDGSMLVDCSAQNLTSLPQHVWEHTTELDISVNKITDISSNFPDYVRHLKHLDLSHNFIQHISRDFMKAVASLSTLQLHCNHLQTLPQDVKFFGPSLTISISANPYVCDCDTLWLKEWINETRRNIPDVDNVMCVSGKLKGTPLLSVADDLLCAGVDAWLVGTSVLAAFVALALIIGATGYIYRGEIKVFLYTRFNWHPFDRSKDDDIANMDFDAFVSYSHHDSAWVCNELRPRLEDQQPYFRLCIHERDFRVGAAITENIASAINTSRRMIIVLSKSFLESHWCHLEFRQAHCKALEERSKYMILVLCEDVTFEDLDQDMRLYIKTNTYLDRKDPRWFWEKLRYAMPLKPLEDILRMAEDRELEMHDARQLVL